MKKLMLDVEAIEVETFPVAAADTDLRGTVQAAMGSGMLSGCLSCRPSGIQHCFNTQTCC